MSNVWVKRNNETDDEYLFRLGSMKEAGLIDLTWPQLAVILNTYCSVDHGLKENSWRKRYARLNPVGSVAKELEKEETAEEATEAEATIDESKIIPMPMPRAVGSSYSYEGEEDDENTYEAAKLIVRMRDERNAFNRMIRTEARNDSIMDLFKEEIHRYDARIASPKLRRYPVPTEKAVYALLSDIHYGSCFRSSTGNYDSDIAHDRVMHYADEIVRIGETNGAHVCYVSLLGDMISGIIHKPIQIENRENAVQQVIGVSELVAEFLYKLSGHFDNVYVNSVSGNHSRIDMSAENALRAEKLDALVPWYCKTALERVNNVAFIENTIDPTVCSFNILGKFYIGVHGDMDKEFERSAMNIERLSGGLVDYMMIGHMHVPNMLLKDRGYIRNGSVCGSGDDYTMRNRLFGNPYQVCMTVTENGIESVWPIAL